MKSNRTQTVYFFSPGGVASSGGMAKMACYTARHWPETSHYRIRIIDTYGPGSKFQMPLWYARAVCVLFLGLALRRVTCVHVNMSERLSVWRKLTLLTIARVFRCPVVLHLHGAEFVPYFRGLGTFARGLVRARLRESSAVLVLGSYWRDFVTREVGIDPKRVTILWNAVPAGDAKQTSPNSPCRFLFLGAVCERKGIDVLFDALAQPSLAELSWTAVIVGNGNLPHYMARADRLGLNKRIKFSGALNEAGVRIELAAADALILPSRNEGLPLAILEAMSFGCAVVATPVGSIQDAVLHAESGLLVKMGDVAELAAVLGRLASDPLYCRKLGSAGRLRQEALFSLPTYVKSLEKIYDNYGEKSKAC